MKRKCLLLLLDGLGDRSYKILGNKTPLQKADTPNLDRLAQLGSNGLYHATYVGQPLPSEAAHLIMFGFEPAVYPGRGPLESLGYGFPISSDDTAMLARFVEVKKCDNFFKVTDRWPKLSEDVLAGFRKKINELDSETLKYYRTEKTFGNMIFRKYFSPYITDTDPILEGLNLYICRPIIGYKDDKHAVRTAEYLNSFTQWCVQNLHYENRIFSIATQRIGKLKQRFSFEETTGMKGLSISSGKIYKGIAKYAGMDYLPVTDTDDCGQDYADRIETAIGKLSEYDFIHVHTKVPDKAAHKKDPIMKMKLIEELDKGIGLVINKLLTPEILLVVSADHSTPSSGEMLHSGEPVPLIVCGEEVRRDNVTSYDEINAGMGCLGLMRGKEFMGMILNYLDRARLFGFRELEREVDFWPAKAESFAISEDSEDV